MEFVSPKHRVRSANYTRPATALERSAAMSSAFGLPSNRQQTERSFANAHTSVVKHAPKHATAAPHDQNVRPTTPKPSQVKTAPTSTNHRATIPTTTQAGVDISTVFETITFNEVTNRSSTAHAKPHVAEKKEKMRANPRKLFSAAVFVTALVGMVAMGYDLFVSPHDKQSVSYVKPTKDSVVTIPKNVKRQASLASYTVESTSPKWLTAKNGVSAPVASEQKHNSIEPVSEDVLGWYAGSAKQGEYSSVVLSGSAKKKGALEAMAFFNEGTIVQLERGDGTTFTYVVKSLVTKTDAPTPDDLGVGIVTTQPELKIVGMVSQTSFIVASLVQQ